MRRPSPLVVFLTGASSFSGLAFAKAAAREGHQVIAPLSRAITDYSGLRDQRVKNLLSVAEVVASAPVGSTRFREALRSSGGIDVLAIHHAVVGDYMSPRYDVGGAISAATLGSSEIAGMAADAGCGGALLTRSVFEAGQGLSSDDRPIGLYAVAKAATVGVWTESLGAVGIANQTFTITNPIGVLEQPRLISYLASTWRAGLIPELRSPHYVRDNIPVDLLAQSYAAQLVSVARGKSGEMTPSLWVGSNIAFAERVGREFGRRWGIPCPVTIAPTIAGNEPHIRIGCDPLPQPDPRTESLFWDDYAEFYDGQVDK